MLCTMLYSRNCVEHTAHQFESSEDCVHNTVLFQLVLSYMYLYMGVCIIALLYRK